MLTVRLWWPSASHKSGAACMSSQASGARAIAAEKPDLPFRIVNSMTRNTPSYSAARVTVIFPGSIPGELRPVGRGYAYDLSRTSGGNPDN